MSKFIAFKQFLGNSVAQSPTTEKIADILLGKGLCFSCVLRYCGNREPALYSKIPHTLPVAYGKLPNIKTPNIEQKVNDCCPACLGILQQNHSDLCRLGVSIFKDCKYSLNHDTFAVSIQLPTQLLVRQRAYSLLLENELENPVQPIDVKEVYKWQIRSAFEKISGMTFDGDSMLVFVVKHEHEETELDFMFLTRIEHAKFKIHTKRQKGRIVHQGASGDKIQSALGLVNFKDFQDHEMMPPSLPNLNSQVSELKFEHKQVYVAGRYCKLKRHISNSAWFINGKRMAEDSVEELISVHLMDFFRANGHKFSSAGREDSDVLMLGTGRPFYFEIIDPKKGFATIEEMKQLSDKINKESNGKITVVDLQMVSRDDTSVLKASATTKSKSYRCNIKLSEPVALNEIEKLNSMCPINVSQRNPTRVPRRADLVREKVIEEMKISPINANDGFAQILCVDLKTSAGTYVKEFMHGDDERTRPSIKELLGCEKVQVESLDVLHVFLDWPPSLSNS